MTAKKPAHPLIPADRVNGTDVYNKAGQKLGKIEDVAIEKVSGDVAYAILSHGGVLGMGEKYYPVPWSMLDYDEDRGGYVVPLDKDTLKTAPAYDLKDLTRHDGSLGGIRETTYDYYKIDRDWN